MQAEYMSTFDSYAFICKVILACFTTNPWTKKVSAKFPDKLCWFQHDVNIFILLFTFDAKNNFSTPQTLCHWQLLQSYINNVSVYRVTEIFF
jgi:hypothetical protein